MMTKNEIIDAYLFLREKNHSIPSETLEFMKDVSLREFDRITNGRECFSCAHDGFQQVFPSACTGCGADGELNHFKLKS
jgi:hypothetical protein